VSVFVLLLLIVVLAVLFWHRRKQNKKSPIYLEVSKLTPSLSAQSQMSGGEEVQPINPLKTKCVLFRIRTQHVPSCKYIPSEFKANLLMLPKPKVTLCSEICIKHVNLMRETLRIVEC
jgi:hypothetical protein